MLFRCAERGFHLGDVVVDQGLANGGRAEDVKRADGSGVSTFAARFVLIRLTVTEICRTRIESVYIELY
jgi:hypothetical protein